MKRIAALALCLCMGAVLCAPALALEPQAAYTIQNPYEHVVWEGPGAWGAYKANLHTHTTFSDGNFDLASVVEEYYKQGYDVLAITDHGVVGRPWNQTPRTAFPLDIQNWFNPHNVLTDARLAEITAGAGRGGRGMVSVPQGIEMNAATVWKSHVNGFFGDWGQGWWGVENDYRISIACTEARGGLSFINHPGDWLGSNRELNAAKDPANVNFFADILRDHPSCLGLEAYNSYDNVTRGDRVLWDELLKRLIPEGRQVFGFANDDSHQMHEVGRTCERMFLPANTVENVRACMESGAFLASSRYDRIRLGEQFEGDRDYDFPGITKLTVGGGAITLVPTADTVTVEWIADGEVIASGNRIDLRQHADKITCYVRAQLIGPGGITSTQAFAVSDGSGYTHPDDALKGFDLVKWYLALYWNKNAVSWAAEGIGGLLKKAFQ